MGFRGMPIDICIFLFLSFQNTYRLIICIYDVDVDDDQAFAINEFEGENFTCDNTNVLICESNGAVVLDRFAINNRNVWYCVMMLVFCLFGYLLLAYLLLIASGKKYLSMKNV
jgi:hypothetical protein